MSTKSAIKNAQLLSGGVSRPRTNEPVQFSDRQTSYFGHESKAFIEQYAKYATDFVKAQVQGLNPDNPQEIQTVRLRMSNVVKPSASTTKQIDDYKAVLLESRNLCYIPIGTKFVTMGSTWLCVNPNNVSNDDGSCIIQRCNAVWRHYDYYGNVLEEPLCVESMLSNANENDFQEAMLIAKGHFSVKCRYNEYTKQLDTNSRLILGTSAYKITGYSDFTQEFTGRDESVHLLQFTIRRDEINAEIDDVENRIAEGKKFSFELSVIGSREVVAGNNEHFSVKSVRNGTVVEDTPQYALTYEWVSSDEQVATVDQRGVVSALSEGETTVTVFLRQNKSVSTAFRLSVVGGFFLGTLSFVTAVPDSVSAYQEVELKAVYFESGEETSASVEWSFAGADENAYSVDVTNNTAVIKCWSGSEKPLEITAMCNGQAATAKIQLEGI